MKMSSLEDWGSRSSAEVKASSAPSSIPGDDSKGTAGGATTETGWRTSLPSPRCGRTEEF